MADTTSPPRPLVTALPNAFYPESTWHDDMELGAIEIVRASRALHRRATHYLVDAGRWARDYLRSDTGDTFNLYDVSALAHADLAHAMGPARLATTRRALIADLRRQLRGAQRHASHDPFGAGVDDTEFDVDSHTFGLIATEGWYEALTHSRASMRSPRDCAVGCWDATRGAPASWSGSARRSRTACSTRWPICRARTNGKPPLDVGAVVNGPNGASLFQGGLGGFQDGMVHCVVPGDEAVRRFGQRLPRRRPLVADRRTRARHDRGGHRRSSCATGEVVPGGSLVRIVVRIDNRLVSGVVDGIDGWVDGVGVAGGVGPGGGGGAIGGGDGSVAVEFVDDRDDQPRRR